MIFIKLIGRQGNQMFQYAFGKLVEKERGIRVIFVCDKSEFRLGGFDGVDFVDSSRFLLSWFFKLLQRYRFQEFYSCMEEVSIYSISNYSLTVGYFQSSKLLAANRSFVRSLFKISTCTISKSNDCVLHIRRGDYLTTLFEEIGSHAVIPKDWFISQIEYIDLKFPITRFLVVGDDADCLDEFCQGCPIEIFPLKQEPMKDFIKLMSSKYLIISNSSFAWWAAFLNIHEDGVVIAPLNWVGYHVGQEYPKGIMNSHFLWK
jgi:hypothetical protein